MKAIMGAIAGAATAYAIAAFAAWDPNVANWTSFDRDLLIFFGTFAAFMGAIFGGSLE